MSLFHRALFGFAVAAACAGAAAAPMHAFEPNSLERIVASHSGKPFVLVVWSLDCEFCRASLKTLAEVKRQRKDLTIVTVSTDPVDDPELGPMMRERLGKLGLDDDAWAFGAMAPERLRYAVDKSWHGEKPRSYWFDKDGNKVAYSGLITAQIITKYLHP